MKKMYCVEAKKRLDEEAKAGKFGTKAAAMKKAVKEALVSFCEQDEEFAQAVVQGDSFEDCMKQVENGVGNSISDLDAYKKAVRFYFPGAEVRFRMEIDVCPNRVKQEEKKTVLLDLGDFL